MGHRRVDPTEAKTRLEWGTRRTKRHRVLHFVQDDICFFSEWRWIHRRGRRLDFSGIFLCDDAAAEFHAGGDPKTPKPQNPKTPIQLLSSTSNTSVLERY